MGYRMGSYQQRVGRGRFSHKRKKGRGSGFGSAGDSSYVSLSALGRKRRFLGKVEKALASKTVYEYVASQRHVSPVNQQGYTYIPLFFSDDIKNAFATSTGTTPNEGGKVYLEYATMRTQIVNQINVPTTVWLYDCRLRRDADDPLQPNTDYLAGIQAQGGLNTDYLMPYSTPFKSSRFCTKWKVMRVTKILLAPGEEHVHTLRINAYTSIAQQRLYDVNSSGATGETGIGGLSHIVMVVSLGGVVNDATTVTNVGFSNAALDIVFAKTYRVAALYDDKHRYGKTSLLPSITTGSTMVEVDADPSPIVQA